jgi:hypothetical protein
VLKYFYQFILGVFMRVFLSAFMLMSFSAFAACPNLSGTFKICTPDPNDGSGSTDMVVTQSINNGVVTYTMTSTDNKTHERSTEVYVADGKVRTTTQTDAETGITFITSLTAACDTNSNLNGSLKVTANDEDFANISMSAKKVGQRMVTGVSGLMMGQDITQTTTCE